MMKTINRIMNSYFRFFKIKDLNLQVILTNDMYETQKKYGFSEEKVRSLDERTARKNWKHVAACMKYPKTMDQPFTLLFKRSYLERSPIYEKYRLVFHELTHIVDYQNYARLNNYTSYADLFKDPKSVLFQNWSEYHAERRGYAAWLKHRYGIKLEMDGDERKYELLRKETASNIAYYGEHYTNTAEYGSERQIYFTMHLLARMSLWMQLMPIQVSQIMSTDPFNYKGIEWIKKLMYLFAKYKEIDKMNDHFMDIARIIAENLSLSNEERWEKVA